MHPNAPSCEVRIRPFFHGKSFVAKRGKEFGFKRDLRAIDYAL